MKLIKGGTSALIIPAHRIPWDYQGRLRAPSQWRQKPPDLSYSMVLCIFIAVDFSKGYCMADTKKETNELIREHEAIRAHMKSLIASLKSMATEGGQENLRVAPLKDQIRLYRWSLYDFREAVRRHIGLDDRILKTLQGSASADALMVEHPGIQSQLDSAIRLAEDAVYKDIDRKEMGQYAARIKETVITLWGAIENHIEEENKLLRQALKG